MYFCYCIESKDFKYAFSNCSVKQSINKKDHRHEGYAKMHKLSENLNFHSLFSCWMGLVSIAKWIQPVKTCFCSKCFVWKIMESRPTLW